MLCKTYSQSFEEKFPTTYYGEEYSQNVACVKPQGIGQSHLFSIFSNYKRTAVAVRTHHRLSEDFLRSFIASRQAHGRISSLAYLFCDASYTCRMT